MVSDVPLYRFKYDNVDMNRYIDNMRFRVEQLRREAEMLKVQADTIQDEANRLCVELLPVDQAGEGE